MKKVILKSASFTNGANKQTALSILSGIQSDISIRESDILKDISVISQNNDVPERYKIYSFFDSKGNGFEAGQVPTGEYTCAYSITC